MALVERTTGNVVTTSTDVNAVNEVQTLVLTSWDATDTIKLTHGGVTSSAVTYASDSTATFQAAADEVLALSLLTAYTAGHCVVTRTDVNTYVFTFSGSSQAGRNVSAFTATAGTGSAAGTFTETTKGRACKTYTFGFGTKLVEVFRVSAGLFENASSNDISITDKAGRTVFAKTGLDFNVSGALYTTLVGSDGKDQAGNALANLGTAVFQAPLTCTIKTDAAATGSVQVYGRSGLSQGVTFRKFTTGPLLCTSGGAATGYINLGGYSRAIVRQVTLQGFDSSTDYVIEDSNGGTDKMTVFSKTALDGTNATAPVGVDFTIGGDGVDQAGNAAADALPMFVKAPLKVTIANGGNATTGSVQVICEVN